MRSKYPAGKPTEAHYSRSLDESERRIAELERERAELRDEINGERKDWNELIYEAKCWHQAKSIRTYVTALKAWAKRNGELDAYAERIDWAYDQADRIDPLRQSAPSVLDTPRDQYRKLHWSEVLDEDGNIEKIWG